MERIPILRMGDLLLVTIIAVGSLKESWWKEAQDEFLRRLAPFAKVEVVEIEPEPFGGTVTAEQSMRREGDRIMRRLSSDGFVIAMERTGKQVSSPEFARLLRLPLSSTTANHRPRQGAAQRTWNGSLSGDRRLCA